MSDRVLAETKFLRLIDRDGWSFVERPSVKGVVTIVAITRDAKLLFVEQYRAPVDKRVIELPAGLAGDDPDQPDEDLGTAARRELLEETGYAAGRVGLIASCPTSPGMTNEIASFFLATELHKIAAGGGVAEEQIDVHEVPLADASRWLRARQSEGLLVAATAYAGLLFALEATR